MIRRLTKAAEIAKAADACGLAGSIDTAVEVSMDIDQLLYEATMLLNAAYCESRMMRSIRLSG